MNPPNAIDPEDGRAGRSATVRSRAENASPPPVQERIELSQPETVSTSRTERGKRSNLEEALASFCTNCGGRFQDGEELALFCSSCGERREAVSA
jgi:protein-arginine kinase activator protein McsA